MFVFVNSQQFKEEYREYLKSNGITNSHIAKKMNISPQQLQNIWKKKELTVNDVKNLMYAINYTMNLSFEKNEL